MRECRACGVVKPIVEFPKAGIIKGVEYWRYLCVSCYSNQKHVRRKNIQKWLFDFKGQVACRFCGNNDSRVLEFDHIDRTEKQFDIGDAIRRGYSKKKILLEINKCQVLCANCRRIKTFEERKVSMERRL